MIYYVFLRRQLSFSFIVFKIVFSQFLFNDFGFSFRLVFEAHVAGLTYKTYELLSVRYLQKNIFRIYTKLTVAYKALCTKTCLWNIMFAAEHWLRTNDIETQIEHRQRRKQTIRAKDYFRETKTKCVSFQSTIFHVITALLKLKYYKHNTVLSDFRFFHLYDSRLKFAQYLRKYAKTQSVPARAHKILINVS